MQHPRTRPFNDEWASFQSCIVPCDWGTRRASMPEDIGMVPHRPPNDTLRGSHRQEFISIFSEISALRSLCPSPPISPIPPIAWRSGTGQLHQFRKNLVRLPESGKGGHPLWVPFPGQNAKRRQTVGAPLVGALPRAKRQEKTNGRGTPCGCPFQGKTPREDKR